MTGIAKSLNSFINIRISISKRLSFVLQVIDLLILILFILLILLFSFLFIFLEFFLFLFYIKIFGMQGSDIFNLIDIELQFMIHYVNFINSNLGNQEIATMVISRMQMKQREFGVMFFKKSLEIFCPLLSFLSFYGFLCFSCSFSVSSFFIQFSFCSNFIYSISCYIFLSFSIK